MDANPDCPTCRHDPGELDALRAELAERDAFIEEACESRTRILQRALDAERLLDQALTVGLEECERLRAEWARSCEYSRTVHGYRREPCYNADTAQVAVRRALAAEQQAVAALAATAGGGEK